MALSMCWPGMKGWKTVVEETINVIFHNFPCSCIFEEREREMARLAVTCCAVINATATICFQPTT